MEVFSKLDALLAALPAACPSPTAQASPAAVLVSLGTPSMTIAVLDKGKISSHGISSIADDEDTLFQACSISKPLTGVVIFKLIEQGKLALHASISRYLSAEQVQQLETPQTAGLAKHITISSLLSHTSGLEAGGVFGFPGYDINDGGVMPDLPAVLAGAAPSNTLRIRLRDWPGRRFSYSGGGTTVLQLIIERVTAKPFPAVVQELVFDPLAMDRSRFAPPLPHDINGLACPGRRTKANFARAYYNGHTPCEIPHRVNPEQAAAGLWSTPTDVLKLGRAIQRSLEGAPDALLSAESAQALLTEVQDGMAHSWFVTTRPHGTFRHAGSNVPGWRCNVVCFADLNFAASAEPNGTGMPAQLAPIPSPSPVSASVQGCGLAVMTNSAEGVTAYAKVMAAICYFNCWPSPPGTWADAEIVIPFADLLVDVGSKWQAWQGWWDAGTWELLDAEGGGGCRPHMRFKGMPPVRLHAAAWPPGPTIDLVATGLEIMLRLGFDESGEQTIEVWHGPRKDRQTLRRAQRLFN
ncbi:beta-lactamase/transpeptidase-like protein [Macrophomina phaseolina]|uniref:Beta-lactamase/transpeptidase-like protein n=1 Tax=Macrophomina phaseolina TaxID=35725 RepID=A0ABQ8G2M9_9PEZI|nr:beta-lactamase/transpeptidase-like protein [Macrophomina phaseolina]